MRTETVDKISVKYGVQSTVNSLEIPYKTEDFREKGENDKQENGKVEEQEYQSHKQAVSNTALLFHSITACSSPSPKWFMTTMHTTTTSIITREMAAPRWGL